MIGTRSGLRTKLGLAGGSVVLALFAVLGLAAAPAVAERGHVFTGSFGAPGSGPGQLGEPAGLAVNEATGDIYYLDKTNNRVEIFNSTGSKFEGEFNGSGLGLGILGSGTLLNEGKAAGSGGLPEEVATGKFGKPVAIAVDNDPSSPSHGDVYVADDEGNIPGPGKAGESQEEKENREAEEKRVVVDKFSASGEYIGQITRNPDGAPYSQYGFREVYGVAVDSLGVVWVEEKNFGSDSGGHAVKYSNATANVWMGTYSTEAQINHKGTVVAFPAPGLAVDEKDDLYVHETFGVNAIVEFNASGELINLEVDEEVPTGVATESSSNDVYISHLSNVHRVDASGRSLEALTVPGGHGSGVAVDSSTLTMFVADSAAGVVDVFGPEAPGAPTVSAGSESIKDVTATSVSFSAEVNPRSEPFEEATSYSFEYGPCDTPTTCSSSPYVDSTPAPAGILAANYEPDIVSAHPQDLLAHTAYHMRLIAHNSHPGVAEGEELTFTTQTTGVFVLPDGRVWEMVSPVNKYGAVIQATKKAGQAEVSEASADGGVVTYHADGPIEAQPPGSSQSVVQAIAARGPDGWQSLNIAAPHETVTGTGSPSEYHFFSSDLSVGLLEPAGAFVPSMSSEATEQTLFLHSDFTGGSVSPEDFCTSSCFTPLVTGAPGVENVPPGTVFGSNQKTGGGCVLGGCGPEFVGASSDASHVVLQYSWAPLVEGAPTGSLYEWAGGRLSVISVLPDESFAAQGVLGTINGATALEHFVRNAVSTHGSRVVWSSAPHLYMRDMVREKTVQLDGVQGGSGVGVAGPEFQAASSDGSRVFFTDSQLLTNDASGSSDLYECEIMEEAGELKCRLTDLTGGSEPAGVMGTIPGVSEDGLYAYFVATGALTGGQANERGEVAVAGQPNLYVRHGGVTSLVAVLSTLDVADWRIDLYELSIRVSPDGRWLSFMSVRPLTGYDNRDARSGKRDDEVFLYHAGERGEGKLACASCNPTGGRPHGVVWSNALEELGIGRSDQFANVGGIASVLPPWTTPYYQSRYLSDSGRLFFDSYEGLVPQDTNSAEDAYQFEPFGVGNCTTSSPTFVVASDGCVGLVSSGTSQEGSAFFDASESGGDVFFLTSAQLSASDTDHGLDIYDAHECSAGEDCSPPVPVPVPACEGDACQSPVAAPEDPTPGSLTYQGPGNPLTPVSGARPRSKSKPVKCKKNAVRRRGKCTKKERAKKVQGAKAKRSTRRGK